MKSKRTPRGFTLVELMMVVGIIGMLASVAMPQFQRYSLRAKSAERQTVCMAIGDGVTDIVNLRQAVPNAGNFTGTWNPVGAPIPAKRAFTWTLNGWKELPMIVQGNAYYSYQFTALDPADGTAPSLTVMAIGDLDGDGVNSSKTYTYVASGYHFRLISEDPPRGQEDLDGPDRTF